MMRRIGIALRLAISLLALTGAAPSRTQTYTAGEVISPSEVTENEDNIFSYLQAGVDTYRAGSVNSTAVEDGTLVNADIASSAAIAYGKLSLTGSVGLTTDVTGTLPVANGGTGATSLSNLITLTTHTTGNYVATLADAGSSTITVTNGSAEGGAATVDAVDVNCSNCIDGTDIAVGSDAQGDLLYYTGTDWTRLGAGTSGQFLQTQGAGANPQWASNTAAWVFVETLTMTGTSVSSSTLPTTGDLILLAFDDVKASGGNLALRYNADSGTNYAYVTLATATLGSATGASSIPLTSSAFEVTGTAIFNRVRNGANYITTTFNLIGGVIGDTVPLRADYVAAGNATSFTIIGTTALSGKVHVFRVSQQ